MIRSFCWEKRCFWVDLLKTCFFHFFSHKKNTIGCVEKGICLCISNTQPSQREALYICHPFMKNLGIFVSRISLELHPFNNKPCGCCRICVLFSSLDWTNPCRSCRWWFRNPARKPPGIHTLSRIIMEVENGYIWKASTIGGSHFSLNHDNGRTGKPAVNSMISTTTNLNWRVCWISEASTGGMSGIPPR